MLEQYVKVGTVYDACLAANVGRATHYRWLQDDPVYAQRFLATEEEAIESLEAVAQQRARERSDLLLIFLLKAKRPEVYRERFEGRIDARVTVAAIPPERFKLLSDEELETVRVATQKLLGNEP